MSVTSDFRRPTPGPRGRSRPHAKRLAWRRWERAAIGGLATGGVVLDAAWKVPMGLPGHRALGWLTLLIAVRLLAGPGCAAVVGAISAAVVLESGISPDGIWGVAQYAIAGVLVDVTLALRPRVASNLAKLCVMGATVLLAVGWIAPLGRSLTGGIPLAELWPSVVSVAGVGLSRLVALDLAFGAVAGLGAWGLARTALRVTHRASVTGLIAAG